MNNSTFGDNVIEGADAIEVTNTTGGVLTIASTFSATSKSRRSLSTKGGYDIQDKSAFVMFSIDPSTTSGNVVELWMYAVAGKYLLTTLSISPTTLATSISVYFSVSNDTRTLQNTVTCNFNKGVKYTLRLSIAKENSWLVIGDLSSGTTSICKVSVTPENVATSFFEQTFTYVLSQSSSGTAVQRNIRAVDESIAIQVSKMGVECTKGNCASSAPSAAKTPSSASSTLNVGIVAAVIAAVGGVLVVSLLVVVVMAAVIVKRRQKNRVKTYTHEEQKEEEEIYSDDEQNSNLILYEAFQAHNDE
jgi:hypothetical protein